MWNLSCVQQASYLEATPHPRLMWMLPLYLHVNQKSDYDRIKPRVRRNPGNSAVDMGKPLCPCWSHGAAFSLWMHGVQMYHCTTDFFTAASYVETDIKKSINHHHEEHHHHYQQQHRHHHYPPPQHHIHHNSHHHHHHHILLLFFFFFVFFFLTIILTGCSIIVTIRLSRE